MWDLTHAIYGNIELQEFGKLKGERGKFSWITRHAFFCMYMVFISDKRRFRFVCNYHGMKTKQANLSS